jgi:hypothetical protein
MFAQGQPIPHWEHRQMQSDADTAAASALLRGLFSAGVLRRYRARYFPPGKAPGIRQALLIDLDEPSGGQSGFDGLRCLWLVEPWNGKLALLGNDKPPSDRSIGGTPLHDCAVLNRGSDFLTRIGSIGAQRIVLRLPAPARMPVDARQLALLTQIEHRVLAAGVRLFSAALNQEVLAAVAAEDAYTVEAYNHYVDETGKPSRNRVQAAKEFPLFGQALRSDWRLRRAVDTGEPLAQALASRYAVQPRTVRRIRTLSPKHVRPAEIATLIRRTDELPADYLPANDLDWNAFVALSEPLADLSRTLDVSLVHLARPFLGGWHQGRQKLIQQYGSAFDLTAIYDMMQATYRYGASPAMRACQPTGKQAASIDTTPPPAFFPLWFGRYSLPRLLDMTARWQDAYRRFSLHRLGLRDPDLSRRLEWPGILPAKGHRRDGYRIVELTSYHAMDEEGRIQQNCLASYAVKCVQGDSAIFSIRDRSTGKPLSTFEIGLKDDRPELLQHQGPDNGNPSEGLQALAVRFLQRVLRPLPKAQVATVRRMRRAASKDISPLLAKPNTEQDPLTAMEQAALAQLVAFAHPKEYRRQSSSGVLSLDAARTAAIAQTLFGNADTGQTRIAA